MNFKKYIGKQAQYSESPNLLALVKIENITIKNDYISIILSTIKGFNKGKGLWELGSVTNFIHFTDTQISVSVYLNWKLNIN